MNIILLNDGSCIVTAEDPDNIADDQPRLGCASR